MVWQGNYDKFFIDGQWVDPASDLTFDVVSPATEEVVARVPQGVAADIDRAVDAARRAFDTGPWPRLPLAERSAVLSRVAELLAEHQNDVAELVTTEMGCPITLSTGMQSIGARMLLESFIETAPQVAWETTRSSITGKALVTRAPVGVVGAIVPWNAPLLTAMLKLAPALLSGCTVVLKPSPETPLSAYLLGDLLDRAGLPAGVVNIVAADREAGEHLVRHPGVQKISFTGSTAAGRRVGEICGHDIRRVTLELGGKSAAVVLDDADLDVVLPAVRALSLRNTGQVCSNKTRIVVAASRREELHERLVALVESMPVGDPFDPATELGPLVSAAQRDRVEGYVQQAVDSGARLLTGGGRPAGLDRGYYVQPSVFADVDPGSVIAQEEVFGPVLTVLTAADDEEAIAIANDTPYGLNGSVFSADDDRALAVARRILTGTVEINGRGAGFSSPMGGFKDSGIGREGGIEGFDTYVEMKSYGLTDALYEKLTIA
ncbi:MAG: aldehyde dehydrogenase [Gordonia sp. (in: high G+C Gram-positive bacteria)]|uniref:aldehyde dehydrogenase n=1 Tax=Gordonia sp. (in: high G+C Gram-positive bacteria) TaxID=84139 RepID=UPI0039E3D337